MKVYTLVLPFAILLSGCAADPAIYRSQSSAKLCMDYLTLPSMNVNQGAREAELARRGESCSQYTGTANARRASDAQFQNTLNSLSQPQSAPAATQGYQQGTHTYMINGRMVTCTTTGTMTNCIK